MAAPPRVTAQEVIRAIGNRVVPISEIFDRVNAHTPCTIIQLRRALNEGRDQGLVAMVGSRGNANYRLTTRGAGAYSKAPVKRKDRVIAKAPSAKKVPAKVPAKGKPKAKALIVSRSVPQGSTEGGSLDLHKIMHDMMGLLEKIARLLSSPEKAHAVRLPSNGHAVEVDETGAWARSRGPVAQDQAGDQAGDQDQAGDRAGDRAGDKAGVREGEG